MRERTRSLLQSRQGNDFHEYRHELRGKTPIVLQQKQRLTDLSRETIKGNGSPRKGCISSTNLRQQVTHDQTYKTELYSSISWLDFHHLSSSPEPPSSELAGCDFSAQCFFSCQPDCRDGQNAAFFPSSSISPFQIPNLRRSNSDRAPYIVQWENKDMQ